jgi:hypothetical protein
LIRLIDENGEKVTYEEFMKKIIVSMLMLILVGCSALPNLPFLQVPTSAPAIVNSPQPTVTLISDAHTNTPDLFAINTPAPTDTLAPGASPVTNTPIPSFTTTNRPTITLEPVDPILFTPGPNPFSFLQKSTSQLVWGSTCEGSRSIKFVIQLTAPVRRLKFVTLWYRLQDKYSGRHTEWGGGAIMLDNDRGTYFYTLELNQIEDYIFFEDAWLQFQFVASSITQKRLGSSQVDRTSVSLTHCKVFNP